MLSKDTWLSYHHFWAVTSAETSTSVAWLLALLLVGALSHSPSPSAAHLFIVSRQLCKQGAVQMAAPSTWQLLGFKCPLQLSRWLHQTRSRRHRHQRLAILLSNKSQKFRLQLRRFVYSKLCNPLLLFSIYWKDTLLPDCQRAFLVNSQPQRRWLPRELWTQPLS